jgi:glycerol-3-phosphate dehydrogenase (NAD(P)+)
MKITVIGFGSWGIALACLLHRNGHTVTAWDASPEYVAEISNSRRNNYLPQVVIPSDITITNDVKTAALGAEIFVLALTSHGVCKHAPSFAEYFTREKIIISGAKGLEETRQIRLSQFLAELSPGVQYVALTGPSHAEEVTKNIPTAILAASESETAAETAQAIFSNETFRVYTSTDLAGAEIGGALKNVIAIAAGISDGLGFGDNTKAVLITRGIAEITRLGLAMGAKEATFAGLSGIGDLIVTCASQHSRNNRAGFLLAQGKNLAQVKAEIGMVVEGADTAKAALSLAKKHKVTMPIIEEVNNVLFQNKSPHRAVVDLMQRERGDEIISQ